MPASEAHHTLGRGVRIRPTQTFHMRFISRMLGCLGPLGERVSSTAVSGGRYRPQGWRGAAEVGRCRVPAPLLRCEGRESPWPGVSGVFPGAAYPPACAIPVEELRDVNVQLGAPGWGARGEASHSALPGAGKERRPGGPADKAGRWGVAGRGPQPGGPPQMSLCFFRRFRQEGSRAGLGSCGQSGHSDQQARGTGCQPARFPP